MAKDLIQRYGDCNTFANCAKYYGVPVWVGQTVADVYMHGPRRTHTESAAFDYMRLEPLDKRTEFYGEIQELTDHFSGK